MLILCTIIGFFFGFAEGFMVCILFTDKAREEAHKEYLKAMKEGKNNEDDHKVEIST